MAYLSAKPEILTHMSVKKMAYLSAQTGQVDGRAALHQVPHDSDAAVQRGPVRRRVAMLVTRTQYFRAQLLH